jgi:hypothetical protein
MLPAKTIDGGRDQRRAQRRALVLFLHIRNLIKHLFEALDRGTLLFGQGRLRLEMFQKHDQSVADLAELLAVARNIRQHVGLDIRLARLAEVDVYEAELAPDRTKKRRPRVDRLNGVAGQRQFEYRHASSPMI